MTTAPQKPDFSRIALALNKAYPREVDNLEHIAAWAEYYALLKDAEAYRNFWKLIEKAYPEKDEDGTYYATESFEGESGKEYFLFNGSETITVGYGTPLEINPDTEKVDGHYWLYPSNTHGGEDFAYDIDNVFTRYAEIPPLPKAQDEASS